MHPIITSLASQFGITLSNRRVCGGHDLNEPCWNGQDLATFWLSCGYDEEGEEILARHHIPMTEAELLHEIGHYVAAKEEQRDLPEYGLGAIVFTTYHFMDRCPSVVDDEEGFIQEFLAICLAVYWGIKYQLPFQLSYGKEWASSWEEIFSKEIEKYLHESTNNHYHPFYFYPNGMWEALIRFRNLVESEMV